MPNYEFDEKEHASMANRMFYIRAVSSACACIGLLGPILLLAGGTAANALDGDTWVSVPVLDFEAFSGLENPFVCQSPKIASCPSGTIENHKGTACYKFHKDHMTYVEAMNQCLESSLLGTLACIHTKEDNAKIHELCKDDSPCWMGLLRKVGSDQYHWSDMGPMSYTNWADGHPHPIDASSDLGSYAVLGYKRWAGAVLTLGALAFVTMSINICIVLVVCFIMHKALTDKDAAGMCAVASCDGVQACGLSLIFLFACIAAKDAEGAGVGGVVLSILFSLAGFAVVAYLVYAGCKLMGVMGAQNEATARESE